jgi:hypothetical protein
MSAPYTILFPNQYNSYKGDADVHRAIEYLTKIFITAATSSLSLPLNKPPMSMATVAAAEVATSSTGTLTILVITDETHFHGLLCCIDDKGINAITNDTKDSRMSSSSMILTDAKATYGDHIISNDENEKGNSTIPTRDDDGYAIDTNNTNTNIGSNDTSGLRMIHHDSESIIVDTSLVASSLATSSPLHDITPTHTNNALRPIVVSSSMDSYLHTVDECSTTPSPPPPATTSAGSAIATTTPMPVAAIGGGGMMGRPSMRASIISNRGISSTTSSSTTASSASLPLPLSPLMTFHHSPPHHHYHHAATLPPLPPLSAHATIHQLHHHNNAHTINATNNHVTHGLGVGVARGNGINESDDTSTSLMSSAFSLPVATTTTSSMVNGGSTTTTTTEAVTMNHPSTDRDGHISAPMSPSITIVNGTRTPTRVTSSAPISPYGAITTTTATTTRPILTFPHINTHTNTYTNSHSNNGSNAVTLAVPSSHGVITTPMMLSSSGDLPMSGLTNRDTDHQIRHSDHELHHDQHGNILHSHDANGSGFNNTVRRAPLSPSPPSPGHAHINAQLSSSAVTVITMAAIDISESPLRMELDGETNNSINDTSVITPFHTNIPHHHGTGASTTHEQKLEHKRHHDTNNHTS